jgi:hypothetical protein
MMDYTKCNFNPIIGADVAITTISDEKRKKIYGKFLFREVWRTPWAEEDNLVLCCSGNIGCSILKVKTSDVECVKATMKPRDMNYERFERALVEIGLKSLKERYNGLEPPTFSFNKSGELSKIYARCRNKGYELDRSLVVLEVDTPYDVTHWIKGDEK